MNQCAHDPCQRPQRPTSKTPRWVLRALGVCGVCCGHTSARGCRRGPRFQVHVARRRDGATALRIICARRTPSESCQSMDDAWMMHAARSCAPGRNMRRCARRLGGLGCARKVRIPNPARMCVRGGQAAGRESALWYAHLRTRCARAHMRSACYTSAPPHAQIRYRLQSAEPSLTGGKNHVRKTQKEMVPGVFYMRTCARAAQVHCALHRPALLCAKLPECSTCASAHTMRMCACTTHARACAPLLPSAHIDG